MATQRGFSLIELLIVVAVIGIIAAIAIPNLLTSRRFANEGSAVSALRTLHNSNNVYAATVGNGSYAGTASTPGTSSVSDLASARLIDTALGSGEKSGYAFTGNRLPRTGTEPETFYFSANPTITTGILATGTKRFGIETEGVIRYDPTVANLATPFDEVTLPAAQPYSN